MTPLSGAVFLQTSPANSDSVPANVEVAEGFDPSIALAKIRDIIEGAVAFLPTLLIGLIVLFRYFSTTRRKAPTETAAANARVGRRAMERIRNRVASASCWKGWQRHFPVPAQTAALAARAAGVATASPLLERDGAAGPSGTGR